MFHPDHTIVTCRRLQSSGPCVFEAHPWPTRWTRRVPRGPGVALPPAPRRGPASGSGVGAPGGRLSADVAARRGLPRGLGGTPDRRVDRTPGHAVLYRHGLTRLLLGHGRDQDRGDRIQKVAESEAANPASLIVKPTTLLVHAGAAQYLHATGAALVGRRWGDDPFWIKILGPYLSRVDDDALHGPQILGGHFRRIRLRLQGEISLSVGGRFQGVGWLALRLRALGKRRKSASGSVVSRNAGRSRFVYARLPANRTSAAASSSPSRVRRSPPARQ